MSKQGRALKLIPGTKCWLHEPGVYADDTGVISATKSGDRWTAVRNDLPSAYDSCFNNVGTEIATGLSLTELQLNVAKYLADKEAGTLGLRRRYGWPLDNRKVGGL